MSLFRAETTETRIDLDMPVAAGELRGGLAENALGGGRIVLAGGLEIEAHAAHARGRHRVERGGGERLVDDGDTAGAGAELVHRIDGDGIVDPVDARRHDHDPIEMERALQVAQIVDQGFRGRIEPAGKIRKVHGVEDVHVAIAGAARYIEIDRRLHGRRRGRQAVTRFERDTRGAGGADVRQHPASGEHGLLPVAPLIEIDTMGTLQRRLLQKLSQSGSRRKGDLAQGDLAQGRLGAGATWRSRADPKWPCLCMLCCRRLGSRVIVPRSRIEASPFRERARHAYPCGM